MAFCEEAAVSEKLGATALYLNPVFTAPSVHKYDTEDYHMSIRNLAAIGRCYACGVKQAQGMGWCWMACLIMAATRVRGLTGITAALAARAITDSPWRDWYSFSPQAWRWTGWVIRACRKLDYQSRNAGGCQDLSR